MNATVINSKWNLADYLNIALVRLAFKRDRYSVAPGIYALGNPDGSSPVFVTANYKYTFNIVRKYLDGINCYILVLDTKGINVWCAAGKGTFGTGELINRIKTVDLGSIVNHRKIIVPQLGAPGIIPTNVRAATGFNISYGPVDAADLKDFISNGNKADSKMRTKKFSTAERFAVSLTHFAQGIPFMLLITAVLSLLDFFIQPGFNELLVKKIIFNSALVFSSLFTGSILAGILLPILPGRAFIVKGFFLSLAFSVCVYLTAGGSPLYSNRLLILSKIIFTSAWIIFQVLNLTGSSTYTSLSGVQKEMKYIVPLLIITVLAGIGVYIAGGFIV